MSKQETKAFVPSVHVSPLSTAIFAGETARFAIGKVFGPLLIAAGADKAEQLKLRLECVTALYAVASDLPNTDEGLSNAERVVTPEKDGGVVKTEEQKRRLATCRNTYSRMLADWGVKSVADNGGDNNGSRAPRQTESEQAKDIEPKGVKNIQDLMRLMAQQGAMFQALIKKLDDAKEMRGPNVNIVCGMVTDWITGCGEFVDEDTVAAELARQRDIAEKAQHERDALAREAEVVKAANVAARNGRRGQKAA